MPRVSFDFSGHVSNADIHVVYEVGSGQNVDVRGWTNQQLADALTSGTHIISLGDYLYGPGYETNVINQTNYQPM
jgi:hypothetical protein